MIRLVFQIFREPSSTRQVLLWMSAQNVHFPYPSNGRTLTSFEWRPIRYRNVISILKNPFYTGVYAYGKSEKRTRIVDGRARKSYGHHKPMEAWEVFIKDHHEGYISWSEYERNQGQLANNAYGRAGDTKSARGGRALLAGLIGCARCGRRLHVAYTGRYPRPVNWCGTPNLQLGKPRCFSFGGKSIMINRSSHTAWAQRRLRSAAGRRRLTGPQRKRSSQASLVALAPCPRVHGEPTGLIRRAFRPDTQNGCKLRPHRRKLLIYG